MPAQVCPAVSTPSTVRLLVHGEVCEAALHLLEGDCRARLAAGLLDASQAELLQPSRCHQGSPSRQSLVQSCMQAGWYGWLLQQQQTWAQHFARKQQWHAVPGGVVFARSGIWCAASSVWCAGGRDQPAERKKPSRKVRMWQVQMQPAPKCTSEQWPLRQSLGRGLPLCQLCRLATKPGDSRSGAQALARNFRLRSRSQQQVAGQARDVQNPRHPLHSDSRHGIEVRCSCTRLPCPKDLGRTRKTCNLLGTDLPVIHQEVFLRALQITEEISGQVR